MVAPGGRAAQVLEDAGLPLDAGTAHAGQGTRNRRHLFAEHYLELLWVADLQEARANPLRLDRRADWASSGASPIGIGLRGRPPATAADDYWLYEGLGIPIWVHRDNDDAPQRPLVFVLDLPPRPPSDARPLLSLRVSAPAPARLPACDGPPIEQVEGAHQLEVVAGDGEPLVVTAALSIRG